MFQKPITDSKIPLNFLDSILSNNSLYEMFKCEFDENSDYFKGIPKSEYLFYMLEYIINKLFSGNLLQYYSDTRTNSSQTIGNIRKFIDDFFISETNKERNNIFSSAFFKALEYAHSNDEYAKSDEEFIRLYEHVMKSCDYDKKSEEIIKELEETLKKEKLTFSEFELLCNYVKNNKDGTIPIDMVGVMLKLHAYKKNHIFDREVVKVIIYSIAKDYLGDLDELVVIEYIDEIGFEHKTYDLSSHTIYIDLLLINTFISGNYIELINNLFYKMKIYRDELLISKNDTNLETLHTIMNMINFKVDMLRIYTDKSYVPYAYHADQKASSFVKALKFYQIFGVDLFMNYINSELKKVTIEGDYPPTYNKEISIDIMFSKSYAKLGASVKKELVERFDVMKLFYFESGEKKSAVDLLNTYIETKNECILEYLETAVVLPDEIINNAIDLSEYTSKNKKVKNLIDKLLGFIYQDLFYYSITNYIKLNSIKNSFNKDAYLNELFIKINSIKKNNTLDKFVSDVLKIIEIEQQNE